MKTAGYSGTPLAKKLGIKSKFKIRLVNEPTYYFELFSDMPPDVVIARDSKGLKDVIHCFVTKAEGLEKELVSLKKELEQNGAIWISWYKKSAKIPTDVTEDIIRHTALKNGLVDIKVCAINEQWSGLKLVIPVKDRK